MFGCIFINTSNKYRTEDKIKVKDGNEYNEEYKYEEVVVAETHMLYLYNRFPKTDWKYFLQHQGHFNFTKWTVNVESLDMEIQLPFDNFLFW